MSLSRLQVFVAVARERSFSRAAERLGLPRSSVSREIARLEQDVGSRLLHRTTRQVGLSTAGLELLERVGPLLEQLERAVGDLPDRESDPSGLLRITATADVGESLLAELVTRYVERYPRVRVEMLLTTRALDLVAEGIDLALRLSGPRLADSSLAARQLGFWTVEAFASPDYLARRGTPSQTHELSHHDWVNIRGMPLPEGITVEPRVLADDMFFVRGALRAGAGLGLMPTYLGRADLEQGTLVRVMPEVTRLRSHIWMVTPTRELPRKVSAFRDLLTRALHELGGL